MSKVPGHLPLPLAAAFALLGLAACTKPAGPPGGPAAAPGADPAAAPPASAPGQAERRFERVLQWQGFSFRVSSPNDSSLSMATIEVSGLATPVAPLSREIDGTVVGAAVGDLDSNGLPEIYVFGRSAGSGSYGSVTALAVMPDRASLTDVAVPGVADDPQLAAGYMGHDQFELVDDALVRRFPIYQAGDANATPSGSTRSVRYRLEWSGDAAALRVDRVGE